MTQGKLPFKYEEEKSERGKTAMSGLPVYLELASVLGMAESISKHLHIKERGWKDEQIVLSLVLLNLAGGDCVDDLKIVEKDEGFCRVLRRVEQKGMSRQEKRAMERSWEKEQTRSIPSSTVVFRYLGAFHDSEQDKYREDGKAFIPAGNEHLQILRKVNEDLLEFMQKHRPEKIATQDTDATLIETNKEEALYSYKGYKACQPINVWWSEQEMIVHTEFRDGNVPAGYEQLRVFKEATEQLPEGVETVMMRSDTAGYRNELLKYCEMGQDKRFGRMEFAVGSDVTREFKKAVAEVEETEWRPFYKEKNGQQIKTNQEWAEVCFVPSAIGYSKNGPGYRYMAIREDIKQLELPGMDRQIELPFPTMKN